MKIAIIADSAPPLSMGGVSSSHYMLHSFLRSQGFDSYMITFCDAKNKSNSDPSILRSQKSPLLTKALKAVVKLFFLLADRQKIACQTSLILENTQGYYQAAKMLRNLSPDLIFAPDYCAPFAFLKGKKGAKLVEIEHHNPSRFANTLLYQRQTHSLDIKMAGWLQQRALRKVDTVICPSQYMQRVFQHTRQFSGTIRHIPNMSEDFGIVITCFPGDAHFAQASYLSVRQFLGADMPICFIVDGDPQCLGRVLKDPNVQTLTREAVTDSRLHATGFGWGFTKMVGFWHSPFTESLCLDADAMVWGDVVQSYYEPGYDFIIDQQRSYPDEEIDFWFFSTKNIQKYYPHFDYTLFRERYACTGTFFMP